ncbi:hypothetical protein ACWEBX_30780, partial [Streptomyces sp. NPDC005070]
ARGRAGTSMPVATDAHASPDGDGLMHRHGPDPLTGDGLTHRHGPDPPTEDGLMHRHGPDPPTGREPRPKAVSQG